MSLLEPAEALDDVVAVVPQRDRERTLACRAVCFLKGLALHLSVGVGVDDYLCDTAYEHDPWAYAEIACYGRVFVDMRGVRAEHARLVRIALPEGGWAGQAGPGEASRMLRDRYGIPVSGMECVPQWLTANARPGGPPPDSESLNLDLARLDLSSRGDRNRTARLSSISLGRAR